ncbi:MAG: nucleotidyltransferase [Candidatus Izimaplasma sp.]|nr:nucleotidyltransferase [Candidatus Izimaplasma bacterium]
MKTVGIITEYNPLHNGHLYHIQKTKELSKCDCLVCVMSGNFTQRGEPAIFDKFSRTKMALKNGVDLVVELPFILTVQNADQFALASVSILDYLHVDEIYFGSESGSIEKLKEFGQILQSDTYNKRITHYLDKGLSYPTSSDNAFHDVSDFSGFDMPNNILGVQYLLAKKRLNSSIKFHTIKRLKAGYYSDIISGTTIQSATSIRKLIFEDKPYNQYMPKKAFDLIKNKSGVFYNDFLPQLRLLVARESAVDLEKIIGFDEGLENRLKAIKEFESVSDLINQVISRRYTNSKIKRLLAMLLINVKKTDLTTKKSPYVRILGMNQIGQAYLNQIKKEIEVPLIARVTENIHPYLDIELRVSKLYSLVSKKSIFDQEFKPLIIE